MKESLQKDFVDEKGNENTVIIEGNIVNNLKNRKYKLQHNSKKVRAKGILTSDIGVHSSGFAGVFGLATILAIGAFLIGILFWRF